MQESVLGSSINQQEVIIGPVRVTEAYNNVLAYLANASSNDLKHKLVQQIQEVANRRNKGNLKGIDAVRESFYWFDPNGDLEGYRKPGEAGELLEIFDKCKEVPSYSHVIESFAPQESVTIDIDVLMKEMADEADSPEAMNYNPGDPVDKKLLTAVKAASKIGDETADMVYYSHYQMDEAEMNLLMDAAQQMTGWEPDVLRSLAILKYFVRNNYSELMDSGDKKQDKHNRKALEQAILAKYMAEHEESYLRSFAPSQNVAEIISALQGNYVEMQKKRLLQIPIADTIITDLSGTLIDTPQLYFKTYEKLALENGVVWTPALHEQFQVRVRAARKSNPNASRMQVFMEMLGMKDTDDGKRHALHERRNATLGEIIQESKVVLQPGVEQLLALQQLPGKQLIVYTGMDHDVVNIVKQYVPQLANIDVYVRIDASDGQIIQRILREHGIDPARCTGIFDAPYHIQGALEAGLASGDFPVFYVPTASETQNLEAQALSLGYKDAAGNRKVREYDMVEIVQEIARRLP